MISLLIAEEHLQCRLEPGREVARAAAGFPETRPSSPTGHPVTVAAPQASGESPPEQRGCATAGGAARDKGEGRGSEEGE